MKSRENTTTERAAELPAHQPGVLVTVPLELLPTYLELRGLRAMDPGEVRGFELASKTRKVDGVLWVTRATEKTNG